MTYRWDACIFMGNIVTTGLWGQPCSLLRRHISQEAIVYMGPTWHLQQCAHAAAQQCGEQPGCLLTCLRLGVPADGALLLLQPACPRGMAPAACSDLPHLTWY